MSELFVERGMSLLSYNEMQISGPVFCSLARVEFQGSESFRARLLVWARSLSCTQFVFHSRAKSTEKRIEFQNGHQ